VRRLGAVCNRSSRLRLAPEAHQRWYARNVRRRAVGGLGLISGIATQEIADGARG
jgi:hypothetical protein